MVLNSLNALKLSVYGFNKPWFQIFDNNLRQDC